MLVCYFGVFEPRQDPTSFYFVGIPPVIATPAGWKNPRVFGDREHSRGFAHIGNVVESKLFSTGSTKAFSEVIDVAAGERITLNEVLMKLRASVAVNTPTVDGPSPSWRGPVLPSRHREGESAPGLCAEGGIEEGLGCAVA